MMKTKLLRVCTRNLKISSPNVVKNQALVYSFHSCRSQWMSGSDQSKPVVQWLISKGIEEKVAVGMLKAFPSPPSISELQTFGMEGIKMLAQSVRREQENQAASGKKINVKVTIKKENRTFTLQALPEQTFYELTQEYPQELGPYLECACRGIAACSTCHVYVEPEYFNRLPSPKEDELDMLDLAWGYKADKSRLGCQIKLNESLDGISVTVPEGVHNFYS